MILYFQRDSIPSSFVCWIWKSLLAIVWTLSTNCLGLQSALTRLEFREELAKVILISGITKSDRNTQHTKISFFILFSFWIKDRFLFFFIMGFSKFCLDSKSSNDSNKSNYNNS